MVNPGFFYPLQAIANAVRQKALKSPKRSIPKNIGYSFLTFANIVCFGHLFVEYIGTLSPMTGPSMLPTLATEGEIVVVDRLSIWLNPYNITRGELIILLSPLHPQRTICKRVMGLPGDVICVDPTGRTSPSTEHVLIPKGHVWISGDNADASRDSRRYGPVPMGLIQGKLRARVWPFSKFTIFRSSMTYID